MTAVDALSMSACSTLTLSISAQPLVDEPLSMPTRMLLQVTPEGKVSETRVLVVTATDCEPSSVPVQLSQAKSRAALPLVTTSALKREHPVRSVRHRQRRRYRQRDETETLRELGMARAVVLDVADVAGEGRRRGACRGDQGRCCRS